MKKLTRFLILLFLAVNFFLFVGGKKVTELDPDTSPTADDLIVTVDSPAGAPVNKKVTVGDLKNTILGVKSIDSSQPDQGVYTKGSVKYYVDEIGTSKSATLLLAHDLSGDYTIYTFSTSVTIPSNIRVIREEGAILHFNDGVTLTPNGPFESPLSKAFTWTGTGKITFGIMAGEATRPEWWDIDGTADEIEINKAIVAAVNIKAVKLQARQYYTANSVLLNQPGVGLICDGGYALIRTSSDYDGIVVNQDYLVCRNIRSYTSHEPNTRYGWWLKDGTKHCKFYNCSAIGFKRGWNIHSTTATGIAYNDFYSAYSYGGAIGLHLAMEGEGWVNENHWFGGWITANLDPGSKCANTAGNQNCFFGVCFQGGHIDTFAISETGLNYFTGCRFEVEGPVFSVANAATDFKICTRIFNNYYSGSCRHPFYVLAGGKARIDEETLHGVITSGTPKSSTVNADSAADQKVLKVASTDGFYVGNSILINSGGDREEWGAVASIQTGVSLTLYDNLRYTHTGAQADAVQTRGLLYGINFRDPNKLDFWTYGVLVLQIASDGAAKLKGGLSQSTDPIP